MLTSEERQKLREIALAAQKATRPRDDRRFGDWQVQTSNSFRRIGTVFGDGDVLCAVTQSSDGHPDLLAPPGVLDYIEAAQPKVMLAILDYIDEFEAKASALIEHQRAEIERMRPTHEIGELTKARDSIDRVIASKKGSP